MAPITFPNSVLPQNFCEALIKNETNAWNRFQDACVPKMERRARSVLRRFPGLVTEEDAQEVVASVCVDLLVDDKRRLRSFDPARGYAFEGWLDTVVANAAHDALRKARRNQSKTLELSADPSWLSREAHDPESSLGSRQDVSTATLAFAELGERDRTFAELYFCDKLEPQAIAERMKISVATVYSKKHKVTARLERAVVAMAA